MIIDATVLGLTIMLMFLMVMLLIGVIHSRLHHAYKAAMIILSLGVASISYLTYLGNMGYAVQDDPPALLQVLATAVREPSGDDAGQIYLWYLIPGEKTPRGIALPYDRNLHKQMAQARGMLERGQPVFARGKKGQRNAILGQSNNAESKSIVDFIPPPNTLPPKDAID